MPTMQFFLPNTDEHGKFSGRKKKTELALKELAQLLLFLMLTFLLMFLIL
jgi:hypothetical protein